MPRPLVIGHSSLVIPPLRRRSGFALLITITLLAFLVLLLVSLASLTRVETQVATNARDLAQARQNALLALNIALGQLQKHAGPDQRITARADLLGGETTPSGRWTGAYGSAVPADYAQAPSSVATALSTPANLNATTGSPARLLSWLVSGNEKDAFSPSDNVGTHGEITVTAAVLAAGLSFSPATAVTGLTAASTVETPLTVTDRNGDPHTAALLVGSGSVQSALVGPVPIDYVAAPLVDIQVRSDTVPGLSGAALIPLGRYAWWVGDENVKARINLPLVTADTAKPAAFASTRRAAIELMDAANPSVPAPALTAPRIGPAYQPAASVEKLLSLRQFTLDNASLAGVSTRRFHDLTAFSTGVLADTYAGDSSAISPSSLIKATSLLLRSRRPTPPRFTPPTSLPATPCRLGATSAPTPRPPSRRRAPPMPISSRPACPSSTIQPAPTTSACIRCSLTPLSVFATPPPPRPRRASASILTSTRWSFSGIPTPAA